MQEQVSDRVKALREEIVKIRATEAAYRKTRKTPAGTQEHERRLNRLQEILDELANLTDWKKP